MIDRDDLRKKLLKEAALIAVLGFAGFVLLPICIYLVGDAVFGEYGNGGFFAFFSALQRSFRSGEPAVLFLLFSPYLLWQLVRIAVWGFRRLESPAPPDV
ncbi:MAG TPA: hypothetical protein VE175_13290 [Woeseiaceae bacterium]|nr:hypothetical protein [Woeseiaceae bacterium]